jgi:alkylation response protein AidB-like acyl-CoA dehydrogenase
VPSAAVYLGVGLAARDAAIHYANSRVPNGMPGPISELQTVQHKIAEIELLLLQARTLLYDVAAEWTNFPEQRSQLLPKLTAAKLTVNRSVLRATEIALTVLGSAGLEADNPVQRHFRDARTSLGHPPMEDAALTTIGKDALSHWHGTHI